MIQLLKIFTNCFIYLIIGIKRNDIMNFLHQFEIQQKFSSLGHPQGNGVHEEINKIIFDGIKERLGEAKDLSGEEL